MPYLFAEHLQHFFWTLSPDAVEEAVIMISGSWVNEELSMWNWRDLGAALREIEADFTTDASSP